CLPNTFEILIHVIVQDSNDADSERRHEGVALSIVDARVTDVVRLAIEFHSELQFRRIEIEPIDSHSKLSTELAAEQLPSLQFRPENDLGRRHRQPSRPATRLFFGPVEMFRHVEMPANDWSQRLEQDTPIGPRNTNAFSDAE